MNDIETYLMDRHKELWYEIYNNEKAEFRELKAYIDYVEKTLRYYTPIDYSYESIKWLFMNKHLDYLHEAFSSLLLGNYNAYSCLMRIIIENYVSFVLIKKYRKKEIWRDWYLFGYRKCIKMVDREPYHSKVKGIYEELCKELDFDDSTFDNSQPYGWLKRAVSLKNYSFKEACKLVDDNIYKEFDYLSGSIHNNDMVSKTNWVDMKKLTKYLFLMFEFTDKLIKEFDARYFRRVHYNHISCKLLEKLQECSDFKEFCPSDLND